MATGDLKGCLKRLATSLRLLKYPREVDYQGLARGDPSSCLPIISFAFTSFSSSVAEYLLDFRVELTGKNDLSFIESVYKVLRDLFSYKPMLTKQQFLQFGFAERKVNILCDIINFVISKHKELTKDNKSVSHPKRRPIKEKFHCTSYTEDLIADTHTEWFSGLPTQQTKPLVERHLGSSTPAQFSLSSEEPRPQEEEEDETPDEDAEEDSTRATHPMECVAESKVRALEDQLEECRRRLGRVDMLERRLEQLERDMVGKIVIDQGQWENLESRVLLLETRLALNSAQKDTVVITRAENVNLERKTSPEETGTRDDMTEVLSRYSPVLVQSAPEPENQPVSPPAAPEENIKDRLERIANMMKDTSSLLRSVEPAI
ncbi:centrosomal protein of 44 kDa [Chanos chanos]|uniref:Centrosomal protein of 44 kDa n=1 Tax=Chanos chanos TaxID=29144 RepID=A0A6J2WKK0_CHACN|nr:centrosomal protein of 44 kDa [Chanos chanos]